MFTMQEAALAYAIGAERVLGDDATYMENNQELVPIFVSLLFQSLEISLKHLGLKTGLFTEQEARDKKRKNGHGVKEIADLLNERMSANNDRPVLMALIANLRNKLAEAFLQKMLFEEEFESTREAYASRDLGYCQLKPDELALPDGLRPWVVVIKQTAQNLPNAIQIVSEWRNSNSQNPEPFAIWFQR